MTLLRAVVAYLESRGASCALIGGGALAYHGVARATQDLDLLTADAGVLDSGFWKSWLGPATLDIRAGDHEDPLAGVVRLAQPDSIVDLVVARDPWMRAIVDRRAHATIGGETIPVVDAADLILTKLAAGGPQDLLDVRLLLAGGPSNLRSLVEARLDALPADVQATWGNVIL